MVFIVLKFITICKSKMNKLEKLQKIYEIVEETGVTAYKIWQGTGISEAGIGKILNKKSTNPQNLTVDKIYEYLTSNVVNSIEEISSLPIPNKNGNTFTELHNGQYLMSMPLIEIEAQAGFLTNYNNLEYLSETAQHSIIVDEVHKGSYVAFRVKGDSMDDNTKNAIANGYIVATRELQRQHWVNKIHFKDFPYWVVYTSKSDYPMLKEIVNHNTENGTVTFHSLNESPEYCDFDLNVNDIQALFYVVDINRNVNNKNYF